MAEDNETFSISLTSPVNATILKSLGTATIKANDGVTPQGPIPPGGTPPGVKNPQMVLGPPTVTVDASGVARMTITCAKASPITCTGSVRLETRAKPKFLMGTRKFTVKKGKKVAVRIYLSQRARKLLTKKSPVKVQAVVIVKNSAQEEVRRFLPGLVTLKASRALDQEGDAGHRRSRHHRRSRNRSQSRTRRSSSIPDSASSAATMPPPSRVAQLAEHPAVNRRVVGSSPTAGAHLGLGTPPIATTLSSGRCVFAADLRRARSSGR